MTAEGFPTAPQGNVTQTSHQHVTKQNPPPPNVTNTFNPGEAEQSKIEVTIAAPVDVVWDALRDKEKIRHWHGWDFDGLDAEIDQIYFDTATVDAGARTLRVEDSDEFTLTPDGDRTLVTITRAPKGVNPDWDAYYDDITEGWITFLQQLRYALERQRGTARRTVFLSGYNESGRSLVDDLGLADLPASGAFAAELLGERVTGEVWFRSAHQLGVALDVWGNGLLVLSSIPALESKPKGAAMVVLSTYGLADEELAELTERWTPWWTERYPGELGDGL